MAHSIEYLQAIYTAAKSFLPAWVWEQVHKKAFPSSGGHAAHRKITKQAAPTSPAGLTSEGTITALQIRGEQYSQTEAVYFQPTKDMTACGACRFFLRSPREDIGLCQIVVGPIAWFGTCDFYISALEEAMFALQTLVEKQDGFEIQTIIFPKTKWTLARARKWLADHDFTDEKVDETENSYRFRQAPPGQFVRIRPICLTPNDADPNLEDCSVLAFGGVTKEDMAKESKEHPGHFQARQKYPEMGTCEGHNCTAKAFDRHHKDGNPANNARGNVLFLCRQCHMLADGRTHLDSTQKADGMTQEEIDEEIDKALHERDRRRRRRRTRVAYSKADEGLTEQEIEIEIQESLIGKQDEAPARALPVPTDAPITNEPWQGAAEVAAMDVARLRRSTLAFVGGDPEVKGNYKLPYRDRRGRINANAVRAIQSILGGGRGGVDLPQSIQAGVRRNARRLMERIQERRVEQSEDGINKQSAECVADRTASNRQRGMDGVSARREAVAYCESVGKSALTKDIPILKLDEEKQIVYGVVLDPYIVDTQGDWSPPSEVEKTAHDWMELSRTIGIGHKSRADATPVESFLMPYPSDDDYRAAMADEPHRIIKFKFGSGFVHSGSWVLGTKVRDEETWALVKSGELGSYSIGGHGERTEIVTSIMPRITETIEADWSQAA